MRVGDYEQIINYEKSQLLRFSLTSHDNSIIAQEFIGYIDEAITEKVAIIFVSAQFMMAHKQGKL